MQSGPYQGGLYFQHTQARHQNRSYSHPDAELYRRIKNKFAEKDMLVISDEDVLAGDDLSTSISQNITKACRDGFILLLIIFTTIYLFILNYFGV